MSDGQNDALVSEFCSITGTSPEKAAQYLEANGWNVSAATNSFFQDEEEDDGQTGSSSAAPAPAGYTGPRTLDGRPAPASASRPARSAAAAQPKRKGIATLGSLGSGSGSAHPPHDDGDDDTDYEDDDDDNRGNLFAGGEKSGLAVQDPKQEASGPRKIISDILAKARENANRPDANPEASSGAPSNQFRGNGMTLGGDGVESRTVPDPLGHVPRRSGTPIERVLHIWQDGFSIDDGELRRFDDPANQMDLQMIRSGRAPLHLMNVQHDQAVDVKLEQHDTPYKPLPKKWKPFGGSGQRLGSPVPGVPATAPATLTGSAAAAAAAASAGGAAPSSAIPDIDPEQPTVTIRLQLPDGTRLPARFNTSSTLGDVYDFIGRASSETQSRPWVLATTFPSKEHTDKTLVIGEMSEFKKGGTAVVKWK